MIDHLDKQTQSLELEPKRGRGRPATGQALSNAERQRLYRERQKAQRNEKPKGAVAWEDARALMAKIDSMTEELEQAKARITELEGHLENRCNDLVLLSKRCKRLSAEKKRRYILQWQDPEKGTWHDDSTGDYGSKAKADAACKRMNADGFSKAPWRVRERQWV